MMRVRPLLQSLTSRVALVSSTRRRVVAATLPRAAAMTVTKSSSSSSSSSFSTKAESTTSTVVEADLQHKLLQRLCWEAYLGSGRGSTTLFQSIDTGATGYISREDLLVFLNSVDGRGVNPKAFAILDVLADDHRIDLREFKSWLVIATKFCKSSSNVAYKASLEAHPHLGERAPAHSEYEGQYSWNEVTMSQSLRRMQYAVRGEVVMKADKLAAEGREILFTNIGNPHS